MSKKTKIQAKAKIPINTATIDPAPGFRAERCRFTCVPCGDSVEVTPGVLPWEWMRAHRECKP